tara:strand:+ start:364 stop:930 length:567 start_codon:yes stop_codon:yes gene_type:complete
MEGSTPIRSIDEILEAEDEIDKVIRDDGWIIPEIDYSNFREELGLNPKNYIDALEVYLQLPYIIDTFSNQKERSEWRDNLIESLSMENGGTLAVEAKGLFESNALRTNLINYVGGFVHLLINSHRRENSKFERAAKKVTDSIHDTFIRYGEHSHYYQASSKDKKLYVEGLKKDIYALLQTVAKEPLKK